MVRPGAGPGRGRREGEPGTGGPSSSTRALRTQPVRLSGRLLSSRPGLLPCGAGPSSCSHPRPPRLRSPCPRRRPTWPYGPRRLSLPLPVSPALGPLLAGRAASPGRLSPGRALPVSAAAAQLTWGC